MASFIALADSAFLETACAELSAQYEFTKRSRPLWTPDEIFGIWIGAQPELPLGFSHSFGFPGRWLLTALDEPTLTRLELLDLLVTNDIQGPRSCEPRFIPVFPRTLSRETREAEMARLHERQAHELRAPLLMNAMTGTLSPSEEASAQYAASRR